MGLFGFGKSNNEKCQDWISKGNALYEQGKFNESITCYDNAIKLDPEFAAAWYNKGIALKKLGRDEESEQCFAKARELDES